MRRPCEICSGLTLADGVPKALPKTKMRRILLGERVVALCEAHARLVLDAGVEDLAELQALFTEAKGGRSFVDRRSPLDRRVFPPRPEGRRRLPGRRGTDPIV